jgi:small subunit ribosomal protein S8
MQDIIANALNCIMNAKRAGKTSCSVPSSKLLVAVLEIMKKEGYVGDYRQEDGRVTIEIGKINECRAIKPRFHVTMGDYGKFMGRYLPARDFGFLIVSTSRGLMTHKEAIEKNIGGSLIAYCF